MAEVDTSIYPKANQNSLLDTLSTVATIKNLGEQNKLLQGQQQRQTIDIDQAKINLAHEQYGKLSQFLGSLAQDPRIGTPAGHQILVDATQQAIDQGWITPDIAKVEIANMPSDPAQIPQYLQSLNTRVLGAQEQFTQIYGAPGSIDNGSQVQPVTVSPITGVRPIAAPITKTIGPETRGDLVQTTDQQGRTVMVPRTNLLSAAGVNPMTAQPETAPSGPANRLVPPSSPAPSQPQQPQQQPTGGLGGVVTSPPAGQIEAKTRTAAASADRYAEDSAREANFQQNILPLQKAYSAVKSLGTTGMGPGSEQLNEIKSFLVSRGVWSPSEELKSFDEARKYLTQAARANGDTGTNDKLAAAFAGNPSLGISNAAAVDVLKTSLSLARLQNAQIRAFQQSGQGEQDYSRWSNTWNSEQDPVAYGFDLMEPEQRLKYIKSLDDKGKARFKASLVTGVKLGLVQPPSAEQ